MMARLSTHEDRQLKYFCRNGGVTDGDADINLTIISVLMYRRMLCNHLFELRSVQDIQ